MLEGVGEYVGRSFVYGISLEPSTYAVLYPCAIAYSARTAAWMLSLMTS